MVTVPECRVSPAPLLVAAFAFSWRVASCSLFGLSNGERRRDLRGLDRHPDAAITSLIPWLSCRSCRPHAPLLSWSGCRPPVSSTKYVRSIGGGCFTNEWPWHASPNNARVFAPVDSDRYHIRQVLLAESLPGFCLAFTVPRSKQAAIIERCARSAGGQVMGE